jgi:tetratricopeptide (TPR) repeat protein
MHIINTRDNAKRKMQNTKPLRRTQNFVFGIILLPLIFCFLSGCSKKDELNDARTDVGRSQLYYQHAVERYKDLVKKEADSERLYFELGQLYFSHGDFEQAVESFRKAKGSAANRFIAISYYRLGNFTEALEIFNKQELGDEEYLYYHGLTCEKLNLFDQALEVYRKIKGPKFRAKAETRIDAIERESGLARIKDADPEVNKIITGPYSSKEYPQAGALILYCDEKVEITPENTEVSTLHYIVKILNQRGKEDFAESGIGYDSTYERVELVYARTIKPDGTVVDVGSRHIRDVSKYLNFPLYSNARVYIISFPEVTEGSCLEYKLKVYRSQLINKKDFILSYPVQAAEPVIAANLSIILPRQRPLNIKTINERYNDFGADLKPAIKENNGFLTYNWQFRNIPQITPEPLMPPEAQINPSLFISTFSSWQDIYNWWWQLAKDKIKADSAIKDEVSLLIKNQNSEEDKIRAIYNFCAQKIRYVAVEYGQAGYEPHYASDIFKNKYGDCKDQAILLVTMLKESGFSSWPVLIGTKEHYNLNEDFPSAMFNHCIAAVSLQDKVYFLDPTAETCPFGDLPAGDQGRKVLIFKEDGYKIQDTPLYPAAHNLNKHYLKIKINSDESLVAEKSVFTYGVYDQVQRHWLLYTQPDLIRQMLKEKIQEVSIGAKLDSYSIENLDNLNQPVMLDYSFRGPEYFTLASNLRIMPQLTSLDTSLTAKDIRRYPLDFGILDSKEAIFEIEIPDNFVIKYMPDDVSEDSPWLKFTAEYKRQGKARIYFSQKIELKENLISQKDYPDFKKFFEGLAKKIKQRIVIERI